MQVRTRFPTGTARNADLITGKYEIKPGDKVLDLDRDLEDMPPFGRMCLHSDTVRLMATTLGWTIEEEASPSKLRKLQSTNDALRAELNELREALRSVFVAADRVGVVLDEDVTELVEAGK